MKTKEEVIKEAYGEYYESVKDVINENGWYDFFDLDCTERKRKLWQFENITMTQSKEGHYIRPKSLQGIENNNGWFKIESEEDLPKENGNYFVYSEVTWHPFYRIDIFTGKLSNSFTYGKSCFTHYQPIIKPKKPLY